MPRAEGASKTNPAVRRVSIGAGALTAAALVVYHNSFFGPFVFDGVPSIPDNPTIRHWWTAWSPPPGGLTVSGRPILNLSFALNYALGGTQVWGYHAVNLLIHICAGLALFGVVRRTLDRRGLGDRRGMGFQPMPHRLVGLRPTDKRTHGLEAHATSGATAAAFAVALLWLVHPLQTEAVTYIVQRAESLMGLFYLLTIYGFIRYSAPPCVPLRGTSAGEKAGLWPWGFFCLFACFFGMATKEVMVSAPVMVFLYDRTFVSGTFREAWRRHRGLYAGLASTWLVLAFAVLSTPDRGGSAGFGTGIPWGLYFLTQLGAIAHYLRLAVWPHPLVFDYGRELVRSPGEVWPQAVLVLALGLGTVWAFLRPARAPADPASSGWAAPLWIRAVGFCGVWFFAILAPTALVPVVTETVAEHRMYLALAPVLAVIVVALAWLGHGLGGPKARQAGSPGRAPRAAGLSLGLPVVLAVAIGFGILTLRRNEVYRTEMGLWRDTLAQQPDNALAHYDLGMTLLHAGEAPAAQAEFEQAVRLAPDYADALLNLGNLLQAEGRNADAIADYQKALGFQPRLAAAQTGLGIALAGEGRSAEAIAAFEEALRLQPGGADGYCNLANALASASRWPDAISDYERALRLEPDDLAAHAGLGAALGNVGRVPEAIAQLQAAERLNGNVAQIHANLATLLHAVGRDDEAGIELEAARRLQPDHGTP